MFTASSIIKERVAKRAKIPSVKFPSIRSFFSTNASKPEAKIICLDGRKQCPYCEKFISSQGYPNHLKKCEKAYEEKKSQGILPNGTVKELTGDRLLEHEKNLQELLDKRKSDNDETILFGEGENDDADEMEVVHSIGSQTRGNAKGTTNITVKQKLNLLKKLRELEVKYQGAPHKLPQAKRLACEAFAKETGRETFSMDTVRKWYTRASKQRKELGQGEIESTVELIEYISNQTKGRKRTRKQVVTKHTNPARWPEMEEDLVCIVRTIHLKLRLMTRNRKITQKPLIHPLIYLRTNALTDTHTKHTHTHTHQYDWICFNRKLGFRVRKRDLSSVGKLLLMFLADRDPEKYKHASEFKFSWQWAEGFMKRKNLSLQRTTKGQSGATQDEQIDICAEWHADMRALQLSRHCHPSYGYAAPWCVFNRDQVPVKLQDDRL